VNPEKQTCYKTTLRVGSTLETISKLKLPKKGSFFYGKKAQLCQKASLEVELYIMKLYF
jgi:hypothetical protein